MNLDELHILQNYPLDIKIAKSQMRIREFVRHFGEDGCYISFSGGKDSTVLLHLVRSVCPEVEAVFSNTGLEFGEVVSFVKKQENVTIVRPEKTFVQVITDHGYPLISKKTARMLSDLQNPTPNNIASRNLYLSEMTKNKKGEIIKNNSFRLANKWKPLIESDVPISGKCCDYLKKKPMKKYERESGKRPIIGTMTHESKMRQSAYLQRGGCNSFDEKTGSCLPISFWTEQDILAYIKLFNLEYAEVYGDIVEDVVGNLKTTGEKRTGCVWCPFGVHLEKGENRFQRLERTHPKLHDYCTRGGKIDERGKWIPHKGLGFGKVLDEINVQWKRDANTPVETEYCSLAESPIPIEDIEGKNTKKHIRTENISISI